jgi:ABC-type sugar transport system ATPase subunit
LIRALRVESGVTVVYVTHRLNELADSAERLLLLHEGDVRVGPVDELLTPAVLREMYGVEATVEHVAGKTGDRHMSKLIEMFQQGFMLNVLAGTMIIAAICSYLGVFIVLRRAVFVERRSRKSARSA